MHDPIINEAKEIAGELWEDPGVREQYDKINADPQPELVDPDTLFFEPKIFNHDKFRKVVRGEITQKELAAKLGLTQARVSVILKQGDRMTLSQYLSICEAINQDPAQFLQANSLIENTPQ
ncbi:MAG: hypothetical protein OXL96_21170 [Candidatus Poribacteria bacterium]|nr:hypothetical protein [Candidatus Poribacteria bacterium]